MPDLLYFEDFPVGHVSTFGAYEVTLQEIKAFAGEFDPQPFHLDEAAGARSVAGALSASGWHTTAICMRMMYDGYVGKSASMGSPGVDEVKWLQPVFAGDVLSVRRTTLEARISSSRPKMGIIRSHWEVMNQAGEVKLEMTGYGLIKVRGAAA